MDLRAGARSRGEPVADLDTFDGGYGHHRGSKARVEARGGLGVPTDTGHGATGRDHEHTAKTLARIARRIDRPPHRKRGGRLRTPHVARLDGRHVHGGRIQRTTCRVPDTLDPREDADAQRQEQRSRHASRGDPRRRLTGTRALEDVAHVARAGLEAACKIGVTGTRRSHTRRVQPLPRGRHDVRPVVPITVADGQRDR